MAIYSKSLSWFSYFNMRIQKLRALYEYKMDE